MSQQTASQQIHPTAVVDPKAELASGWSLALVQWSALRW